MDSDSQHLHSRLVLARHPTDPLLVIGSSKDAHYLVEHTTIPEAYDKPISRRPQERSGRAPPRARCAARVDSRHPAAVSPHRLETSDELSGTRTDVGSTDDCQLRWAELAERPGQHLVSHPIDRLTGGAEGVSKGVRGWNGVLNGLPGQKLVKVTRMSDPVCRPFWPAGNP